MKILLITPVHPKLSKAHPLPEYQVQNYWLKALKKLNHQVLVFGLQKKHSKLINFFKLNHLIKTHQPDQLFFSAGLDKLYPTNQTVFFCGVPPYMLSSSEQKTGQQAQLIVVNDQNHQKQWQKLTKSKIINLPFSAVDINIFKPGKIIKTIDISFIGTLFHNRQLQLIKLVDKQINFKIWGWLPPKTMLHPDLKAFYQGEAWGQQIIKIYQQSKMALNLIPDHMIDGGNLRAFEIPACQTMQISNQVKSQYYKQNQEIILFKNQADFKKKVKYYLKNKRARNKIALNGYQKTINHHTFDLRFKKLFNYV